MQLLVVDDEMDVPTLFQQRFRKKFKEQKLSLHILLTKPKNILVKTTHSKFKVAEIHFMKS